jgi:hypothetical protein
VRFSALIRQGRDAFTGHELELAELPNLNSPEVALTISDDPGLLTPTGLPPSGYRGVNPGRGEGRRETGQV